jgi:hypothetical protein
VQLATLGSLAARPTPCRFLAHGDQRPDDARRVSRRRRTPSPSPSERPALIARERVLEVRRAVDMVRRLRERRGILTLAQIQQTQRLLAERAEELYRRRGPRRARHRRAAPPQGALARCKSVTPATLCPRVPLPPVELTGKLNLNTASVEQLMLLPGVGPVEATSLVA